MNGKTAKLIRKAANIIDPMRSAGTLREQRRAWQAVPWHKRHESRLELRSIIRASELALAS